jgi:hypothetical protein
MEIDMHYYELDGTIYQLSGPLNGAVKLSKAEGKRKYCEQAKKYLREWLPEGSTVFTLVRSVSKSGLSRQISVFCIEGKEIKNLDWMVSQALDWRIRDAICVQGAGMSMTYHLVDCLSFALYGGGGKLVHRDL